MMIFLIVVMVILFFIIAGPLVAALIEAAADTLGLIFGVGLIAAVIYALFNGHAMDVLYIFLVLVGVTAAYHTQELVDLIWDRRDRKKEQRDRLKTTLDGYSDPWRNYKGD